MRLRVTSLTTPLGRYAEVDDDRGRICLHARVEFGVRREQRASSIPRGVRKRRNSPALRHGLALKNNYSRM
jgi:hypothetical protein